MEKMHPEDWNLPIDVWNVTTSSYTDAHFATFPLSLIEDPILQHVQLNICKKCGKPREESQNQKQ